MGLLAFVSLASACACVWSAMVVQWVAYRRRDGWGRSARAGGWGPAHPGPAASLLLDGLQPLHPMAALRMCCPQTLAVKPCTSASDTPHRSTACRARAHHNAAEYLRAYYALAQAGAASAPAGDLKPLLHEGPVKGAIAGAHEYAPLKDQEQ